METSRNKKKKSKSKFKSHKLLGSIHEFLSWPIAILCLTYSNKVHPDYGMTWGKRMLLGFRFRRKFKKVRTGTSWRAHLVMAMKLLEMSPQIKGSVVECGCWKGGATVNLSLICALTGRTLKVYDSFEGLPEPTEGDPVAARAFKNGFIPGVFGGTLDEVRNNVSRYGAIDACQFYKGWFSETLPHHEGDIVLAFWDVDFHSSLHDCLQNLWPSIVNTGMVFLDDYLDLDYCAVFYSEKYWSKYFKSAPPGLIGAGTGIQVGMFYTDPSLRIGHKRIHGAESITYCIKGTRAIWEFYPDENHASPSS